ncbi:glutaredoxin [Acanthocystis turfacea Chlorella virus Canal-1]|nr:glutaredoxin [Acanthocystis turfacea Chlorella virus Canal-1]
MFLVFSKDGCKYCAMAIKLLTEMKKDFHVIKLLDVTELNETLFILGITAKTFPQVFMDGDHIGGYTELHEILTKEDNVFEINDDCF